MTTRRREQLLIDLQYKAAPADHPRVRRYLEKGYRVVELQRVSDGEAIVTVEAPPPPA
jgi:hypothetical protein